jgi:hypothetical protein
MVKPTPFLAVDSPPSGLGMLERVLSFDFLVLSFPTPRASDALRSLPLDCLTYQEF